MAAEPGPGPAGARPDGNGGDRKWEGGNGGDGNGGDGNGALTGRAWLAALPDELAAQRRVMARLVDRCEAWPLARSLLVGCSLGRGAADALSDVDAALGVDTERGRPAPSGCGPRKLWSWRRCRIWARPSTGRQAPDRGPLTHGSGGSSPSSLTAPSSTWRSRPKPASRRAAAAAALRTSSRSTRHPPRRTTPRLIPAYRSAAPSPAVPGPAGPAVPSPAASRGAASRGAASRGAASRQPRTR